MPPNCASLRDDLYRQLLASDPQGVLHPFAALALSEVAHGSNRAMDDGDGGDASWLARQHDLKALFGSLYIEADQTQNPALARLKPMLAKALAATP